MSFHLGNVLPSIAMLTGNAYCKNNHRAVSLTGRLSAWSPSRLSLNVGGGGFIDVRGDSEVGLSDDSLGIALMLTYSF
jgi:hypothetical protein